MSGQKGFWDVDDRLAELSAEGDPLEKLSATVDFEVFRPVLLRALRRSGPSRMGRPPFCPVLMFRMLVLQSLHGLSLERTAYRVRDRLSWMRFCGLGPADRVPDVNSLWDFREALIQARALDKRFARLNEAITKAGDLPMGGQIVDASLIAAPKSRNTDDRKAAIKDGKRAAEIWPDEPNKARQKDVNARWTVKQGKSPAPGPDGKTPPAPGACPIRGQKIIPISIPVFGYKDHIGIDRRFGFIRTSKVTDAAAHDGARLREGLIDPENTASDGWADSAYRSVRNEEYLDSIARTSRIHRKKPNGRPMSKAMAIGIRDGSRPAILWPMRKSRRSAAMSSLSLPNSKAGWGSLCAPSASPAPRRPSRWPISPTPSAAMSGRRPEARPHEAERGARTRPVREYRLRPRAHHAKLSTPRPSARKSPRSEPKMKGKSRRPIAWGRPTFQSFCDPLVTLDRDERADEILGVIRLICFPNIIEQLFDIALFP